jgi:hypothetical protein
MATGGATRTTTSAAAALKVSAVAKTNPIKPLRNIILLLFPNGANLTGNVYALG